MRPFCLLLLLATVGIGALRSETSNQLVGTWRLVSFESRYESGEIRYPFGQKAIGQLSYGTEGRVSAILVQPDRPLFTTGDMRRGTDREVRSAFEGFIGYFGTYSVNAAESTVTHHVQGACYPNWMGGDQVRSYKLEGTKLILSTPPILYDGQRSESVLVWERVE
jgi:Lipocalin-like domain